MAEAVKLVLAAVAALAVCAGARAADMPGQWPQDQADDAPQFRDTVSGWYLRGDIGYRWHSVAHATGETGFPTPDNNSLDQGFWGGVGAGFKTGAVRVDLTVDHGAAVRYSGTAPGGSASAKVQATSALLNLYYDIGTWSQFTPYIGAGLGGSYLRVSDVQTVGLPPLAAVSNVGRWNMAWAVMAGASYQFTPTLAVDTGYRLLGLGSAETGADASGKLTLNNITAHEFRVGLRWSYDSLVSGIR